MLGQLIYIFALDRFHLKTARPRKFAGKGSLPALLESSELHRSAGDGGSSALAACFATRSRSAPATSLAKVSCGDWRAWLRVVVLDPDANLVPAMRAGAFGLSHGRILILYPEGERTNDGTPRLFRKGAAILSIHTQAPIVPVAIEGFYEAWPRHKKFPKFTDLQLVFGKPIQPPPLREASEAAYERLTSELKAKVVAMWKELERRRRARKGSQRGACTCQGSALSAGTGLVPPHSRRQARSAASLLKTSARLQRLWPEHPLLSRRRPPRRCGNSDPLPPKSDPRPDLAP